MKHFWVILPLSGRDLMRALLGSGALAYALCSLTMRYWIFFHLQTPGSRLGLFLLVLPLMTVLGAVAWLRVMIALRRRHSRPIVASWGGLIVVLALFAGLFGAELVRTREWRSGEGVGAGNLGPFFQSLVRRQ